MKTYKIILTKEAKRDLKTHYESGNKPLIKKIEKIFIELSLHPFSGTGKPEPLKNSLQGLWSRRLNQKHRIVYEVISKEIIVKVIQAKGHYD